MNESVSVQVRICPSNSPTYDLEMRFLRVPQRGETIIVHPTPSYPDLRGRYVVVEVDWEEGEPFVIAHGADRPRAIEALRG